MKNSKLVLRFGIICLLILTAALSRLIPHPANFAPIGGMALFGAAYYSKKYWSFIIPIIAMWISDLAINNIIYAQYFDHFVWFYKGSFFTYLSFALIVILGLLTLKKVKITNLIFSALGASIIFFIVSNFGVWASTGMYPKTIEGLGACYIAGIPFFKNTILGDLVYTGALFGIFELILYFYPSLKLRFNKI